jgi:hypothetical protein
MKNTAQKLEAEMAKAISLIVAASHAAAIEVLDEAFGVGGRRHERRGDAGPRRRAASHGPSSPRRSVAEITALEKQFFDAVLVTPGEAMSVLAPRLGIAPNRLLVPVARLKSARRIKTVGSRQFTRYFPIEAPNEGSNDAPRN